MDPMITKATIKTIPVIEMANAAVFCLFLPSFFLELIEMNNEIIFSTIKIIEHKHCKMFVQHQLVLFATI